MAKDTDLMSFDAEILLGKGSRLSLDDPGQLKVNYCKDTKKLREQLT